MINRYWSTTLSERYIYCHLQDTENQEKSSVEQRNEVVDTMSKIEKEFAELKDSLFSNSIKWLEKDAQRISSG